MVRQNPAGRRRMRARGGWAPLAPQGRVCRCVNEMLAVICIPSYAGPSTNHGVPTTTREQNQVRWPMRGPSISYPRNLAPDMQCTYTRGPRPNNKTRPPTQNFPTDPERSIHIAPMKPAWLKGHLGPGEEGDNNRKAGGCLANTYRLTHC